MIDRVTEGKEPGRLEKRGGFPPPSAGEGGPRKRVGRGERRLSGMGAGAAFFGAGAAFIELLGP